jgi:predicted acyl esterase
MFAASPTRSGVAGWIAARVALWGRRAIAKTKAPFDVELTSDVMERMRDGVRPATDICRPARDGRPLPGPASR